MVEGLRRCESQIESLAETVGALEKLVRTGWKEDRAGSSGDAAEEDKDEESEAEEAPLQTSPLTKAKAAKASKATAKVAKDTGVSTKPSPKPTTRLTRGKKHGTKK